MKFISTLQKNGYVFLPKILRENLKLKAQDKIELEYKDNEKKGEVTITLKKGK